MTPGKVLLQTLGQWLPARWRARLWQGLRTDHQAALVAGVDVWLLQYERRLYHLGDGSWCDIEASRPGLDAARQLAAAAARLMEGRPAARGLALLLPPSNFAATRVALPGVAADAVRPALELQVDQLLPGINEPLALVVNPLRQQSDGAEVALWMSHNRLVALSEAFAERQLSLLAVMPRALLGLLDNSEQGQLEDIDSQTRSYCQWQHGALTHWLQVAMQDLQEPAFAAQWQHSLSSLPAPGTTLREWSDVSHYQALARHHAPASLPASYCFVPPAARQRQQQALRRLRATRLSVALVLVLALGTLPWLWQSVQLWRLQASLEALQRETVTARRDQFAVRDFELDWAAYEDFPRRQMAALLFELQSLLSPDLLSVMELRDGELQLEGQSADPQSLLQRLAAHPDFEQVRFLRATSNNRYAIGLRLQGVDFASYDDWYFGDTW